MNKATRNLRKQKIPKKRQEELDKAMKSLEVIEATIKPFKPSKMIVVTDLKEKWVLGNSKENTVSSDQ